MTTPLNTFPLVSFVILSHTPHQKRKPCNWNFLYYVENGKNAYQRMKVVHLLDYVIWYWPRSSSSLQRHFPLLSCFHFHNILIFAPELPIYRSKGLQGGWRPWRWRHGSMRGRRKRGSDHGDWEWLEIIFFT